MNIASNYALVILSDSDYRDDCSWIGSVSYWFIDFIDILRERLEIGWDLYNISLIDVFYCSIYFILFDFSFSMSWRIKFFNLQIDVLTVRGLFNAAFLIHCFIHLFTWTLFCWNVWNLLFKWNFNILTIIWEPKL